MKLVLLLFSTYQIISVESYVYVLNSPLFIVRDCGVIFLAPHKYRQSKKSNDARKSELVFYY